MESKIVSTSGVIVDTDIQHHTGCETIIKAFFCNICSGDFHVYKNNEMVSIFFTNKEDVVKIKLKDSLFNTLKELCKNARNSMTDPWDALKYPTYDPGKTYYSGSSGWPIYTNSPTITSTSGTSTNVIVNKLDDDNIEKLKESFSRTRNTMDEVKYNDDDKDNT